MNRIGLEYWKKIDTSLHDMGFNLTHTIDDYNHCYYKDGFDGWVECDIDNQTVEVMKYTTDKPFTFLLENMENVDENWFKKLLD